MPQLPPITVFDLETTGLDPKKGHRIVEIAGVRMENGILRPGLTFTSFVNPERDIPLEARQVNKISDDDLRGAPTIEAVLPQFLAFAQGTLLIAHNAEFDYGFLEREKEFCWGYVELPECLCTLKLSQYLYPTDFRYNLDMLSRKFGLALPEGRHRALDDALLTAQVLQKMLETGKVQSVEELRKRAGVRQMVKEGL